MAEAFLSLSPKDRRDALAVASAASGRPLHLLEKDVWVVWALETLFGSAIGANLVFKGGTSLSKAYSVIRRFSEDVDLTLDMRALAPDLIAGGVDGLPSTRSQEPRWSKELKVRLADWVQTDALR
jgi:Nucleotidyl transferase AbiEii toxin, Type IV TA system